MAEESGRRDNAAVGGAPVTHVTVSEADTVGAVIDGMPYVAATPYLVKVAEVACYRLVEPMLDEGQITVGSRVVIDHLGSSKVGTRLAVSPTLVERAGRQFRFTVKISDGDRLVGRVEHTRTAVLLERLMGKL